MSFDATVAAMTDSIVRDLCAGTGADAPEIRTVVTSYVLEQHGRMPDYLRLPFKVLTSVFDIWSIPLEGRPFHRLPHERRLRQIGAWRTSRLGFRQNLIKFFETLIVWGWYSEVYQSDEWQAAIR